MDFGTWEMQPWATIPRAELDAWAAAPLAYRGHGGEAVEELMARAASFLADLPTLPAAIVVTHSGIMKCLVGQLLGLPRKEWFALHFDYAAVCCLEREAGGWRLIWQNTPDG